MKRTKLIKEIIKEENEEAHLLKGFDKALVGTGRTIGSSLVAVYDTTMILEMLIEEHDMSELEAYDHFYDSLNKESYQNTPIFINDFRKIVDPNDIVDRNDTMI